MKPAAIARTARAILYETARTLRGTAVGGIPLALTFSNRVFRMLR